MYLRSLAVSLLLCLALLPLGGEEMTDEELLSKLTRLEGNLEKLRNINAEQKSLLSKQEKVIERQRDTIGDLQKTLSEQTKSLQTATDSFEKSVTAFEEAIQNERREKWIWSGISAAGALGVGIIGGLVIAAGR